MMSRSPLLFRFLHEDVMRSSIDLPRCDDQIGGCHQANELWNQQTAPLHVVVDPHVSILGRLGDDCVDHVLWKSIKFVPVHDSLPVDADLTCNTLGNHCGNAKLHTSGGNFFAIRRERNGTLSPFVNGWINEAPHSGSDQQQRHADQRSPVDAVEIHGVAS